MTSKKINIDTIKKDTIENIKKDSLKIEDDIKNLNEVIKDKKHEAKLEPCSKESPPNLYEATPKTVIETEKTYVVSNNFYTADELLDGKIGYFIPDSMIQNKTYRIYMTLSVPDKKIKIKISKQYISPYQKIDTSKILVDDIKLGNTMNATLVDPTKSFNISSIGDETKILSFDSTKTTETWMWDIIPLKSGEIPLTLKVEVVINKNGTDRKTRLEVFNKQLMIKAEYIPWYKKTINFLKIEWKWLITTIIIPLVIWYRKKRKKD
jgi:hypothetical protein